MERWKMVISKPRARPCDLIKTVFAIERIGDTDMNLLHGSAIAATNVFSSCSAASSRCSAMSGCVGLLVYRAAIAGALPRLVDAYAPAKC